MDLTITYKGIDFDVTFDYQPEEKMVRYYPDGSGYPGCAESIDNIQVYHNGTDFTELFEDYMHLMDAAIREAMSEHYE